MKNNLYSQISSLLRLVNGESVVTFPVPNNINPYVYFAFNGMLYWANFCTSNLVGLDPFRINSSLCNNNGGK